MRGDGHPQVRAAPARRGGRGDAAAHPRRALRAAARSDPPQPVSVDEIARAARRLALHDLPGLRLARRPLRRARRGALPQRRVRARRARQSPIPTGARACATASAAAREMFAAHRDVFRVLHSMAQLDATAVGGAVQRLEEARAEGMTGLAQKLAVAGSLLRPRRHDRGRRATCSGCSRASTPSTCSTRGRGLPLDEVVEVLVTTAERSPLPLSGGRSASREGAQEQRSGGARARCARWARSEVAVDGVAAQGLRGEGCVVHGSTVGPRGAPRNRRAGWD